MLDEVFAEAVVHAPLPWWLAIRSLGGGWSGHKVLGLRLRPFSFWHAFNLDLVGYASTSSSASSFTTLLLAARCCRLKYPQTIATTGLREAFRAQLSTLRFAGRYNRSKSWRLRLLQIKKFEAYRKDYADYEAFSNIMPDGGGESVKLPSYLHHVALLRHFFPDLTKAQAWNYPIGEAQWEILAASAAQGTRIDILTPEDRRDIAEMEKEAKESSSGTP